MANISFVQTSSALTSLDSLSVFGPVEYWVTILLGDYKVGR